ncbi:hypothetical protein MCOR27_007975 [Pyricularia oryzae]|uniref:Uncharacterized protein n=1 Tax=Pyricularia grisea TaxID=148305 RepID=A0ABQ8NLM7_PYRGI|nr:hypothetical protein MCOR01_002177 [Pyricularia oryzae]KAI6299042.1 hypothetical protein MCOR33_004989 [Pyricularia grisea]KAI6261277.1 hypothetical protein MCOR19_002446 [Pyricularia oryzae]KAI6273234.1 hypothetical protein MCOR27_007975 [Pyricularia oryzae]KAI6288246.1 hypothetical protein MCOR26_000249 [Pyricularia oryzae]
MENGNNRPVPNGQSSLPTFVGGKSLSAKKHLDIRRQSSFERQYDDNSQSNGAARRRSALPTPSPGPYSSSTNNHNPSSSFRRSQLPRPGSSAQQERPDHANVMSNGQYMSLHEAMRRSPLDHSESEESSARGSPSPAPREHLDGIRSREFKGHFSKIPLNLNRRPSSRQSTGSGGAIRDDESQVSGESSPDGRPPSRLRQPTQYNTDRDRISLGGGGGLFFKTRDSDAAKPAGTTGRELSRKASTNSLDGRRFGSWGVKGQLDPNFKRRLMSPEPTDTPVHDSNVPIPSTETAPINRSPEKSFAWGAEADFTAGDLQVSDSPPVKVIPDTRLGLQNLKSFQPMVRSNTRIDEIRRRENEAMLENYEHDEPESTQEDPEIRTREAEPIDAKPLIHRTNHKLEELRIKEMASLSKKSLAKERLDDIRRRNSASRSLSPEAYAKLNSDVNEKVPEQPKDVEAMRDDEGEAIPDTPVIVYRSDRRKSIGRGKATDADIQEPENDIFQPKPTSHYRKDSHDLLKRLARAASSSPSQEKQAELLDDNKQGQNKGKEPHRNIDKQQENAAPTSTTNHKTSSDTQKETGDLARRSGPAFNEDKDSAEMDSPTKPGSGASSKRSSATFDPTERITSEKNLFEPREDGQSERAASAAPSEPDTFNDVEETPRAKRPDPQLMPTPKPPGGYVETPATVKVQDFGVRDWSKGPVVQGASVFKRPRSLIEVKARSDGDKEPIGRSSSISEGSSGNRSRRRSKSLPRALSPLKNSVKLPSASEDLEQIKKKWRTDDDTMEIDFDTIEDLDELMKDLRDTKDDAVVEEKEVEEKQEKDKRPAVTQKVKAEEKEELDILGRGVHRALREVQDSRKGIERLIKAAEANPGDATAQQAILDRLKALEQSQSKSGSSPKSLTNSGKGGDPVVEGVKATSRYITSWFWHSGGPSWLGSLLILVLAWACLETATCSAYCRPTSCSPGQDCSWTPSDPFPGYALPVKVDQWTTGGRGRVLFERLTEEIGDLVDDAKDMLMDLAFGGEPGSSGIRKKDERFMTWEERRRYRRRLARRGLIKKWSPPPEYADRFAAWGAARKQREYAASMREMGYDRGDGLGGESMDDDERVS